MQNYNQPSSDSMNINGMFLKFYLDTMFKMTDTFQDQNTGAFNLYAYFLRACIPTDARRDDVDREMIRIDKKIKEGVFGKSLTDNQKEFIRGFAVVTASVKFLDTALRITMHDGSAMADINDEELMLQIEKMELYKRAGQRVKNKKKRAEIERAIFDGAVTNNEQLDTLIDGMPFEEDAPEELPQDSPIVQDG